MSAIGFCFEQFEALHLFHSYCSYTLKTARMGSNGSSSTFWRGHCSKKTTKNTTIKNTRNSKDLIINLCTVLQYSSACFRLQMTERMAHHSFLKILILIWGQQRGWKASSSCSTNCQIISTVCQLYAASLILNVGGIMFLVSGSEQMRNVSLCQVTSQDHTIYWRAAHLNYIWTLWDGNDFTRY